MPEIKNTFIKGRMNKDLDERLVPNGEYRDAMNIQVSTSEGADVGTVQNILGNTIRNTGVLGSVIPNNCKCVGTVADEKNNRLYWFIKKDFSNEENYKNLEAIIEYIPGEGDNPPEINPVIVDTKINTPDAVLKFPDKIITGINIVDNLLFWTDGINEPRKINIDECKKGTVDIDSIQYLVLIGVVFMGLKLLMCLKLLLDLIVKCGCIIQLRVVI